MRRVLLIVMTVVALWPTMAMAQTDNSGDLVIDEVDTSSYPEVTILATVPGTVAGSGLDDDAFAVVENGVSRPATATALPSDDLHVVLLLDASGSMSGEPVAALRESALGFVQSMPRGVQTAVVSFATAPDVLSEFTAESDVTAGAIQALEVGGETALYDGLGAAADMFAGIDGRGAIVVLSDGGDTVSEATVEQATSALASRDVGFYAIELQSPEYESGVLAGVADATGGTLVAATDPGALAGTFDAVANQITNRYEISYASEAHGETEIELTVTGPGGAATARTGNTFPDPPPPPTTVAPEPEPVVTQAPPAPLRNGFLPNLGFLETTPGLILGLAAISLAIGALVLTTGGAGRKHTSTLGTRKATTGSGGSGGSALTSFASEATNLAERALKKGSGRESAMSALMERAGVWLRPAELVVITGGLALGAAALGFALLGAIAGLAMAVVSMLLVRLWLGHRATKRENAFAEQLPDVLQLMAGGLRAGFGLMQAIENVASEISAPAGEELQRVKVEVHLGRDTDEALRAMARRIGSEDFEWVVEAIEIHREVGGDLGEILDSVGGTIRERNRIRRRVKSLSAEGRISALVLAVLPLALACVIAVINPSYLAELPQSLPGQIMIVFGVVAMFLGAVWMRHITQPKF